MSFFQNLVDQYIDPDPKGFTLIASRLKRGDSPLKIRNQLIEETGGSKLATGKLVEQVVRSIKVAQFNRISGGSLFILCFLGVLFLAIDIRLIGGLVIGAAQFVAGQRIWKLYKQANIPEIADKEKSS